MVRPASRWYMPPRVPIPLYTMLRGHYALQTEFVWRLQGCAIVTRSRQVPTEIFLGLCATRVACLCILHYLP